jgi:hypothetical protein
MVRDLLESIGGRAGSKVPNEWFGVSGSNGTASRVSRRNHCTRKGIQDIYGTDPGRV